MAQKTIKVPGASGHGKGAFIARRSQRPPYRLCQFRGTDFIAVKEQYPFRRRMFLQPLHAEAYLSCVARPRVLNEYRAVFFCNALCGVAAERVDDENPVAEGERIQTASEQTLTVERDDDCGELYRA